MTQLSEIFGLWDKSPKAMSEDLGVPYQTVAKWFQRNRIPAEYWGAVIKAAPKGSRLTFEHLAKANPPRGSSGV